MRKLIVPLTLAALGAATPAIAAKPDTSQKRVSARASQASAANVTLTASKKVSAQRVVKAAKKPAAAPAAPPKSNEVAACGSSSIFGTAASACAGFFEGNLLGGSPDKLAAQDAALAQLGFDFSSDANYLKIDTSDATFLDFGQELFGNTIIGIHFGNGSGVGNSTGFFEFNFTSPVNGIALNIPGSSGVVLYQTGAAAVGAVPEPGTWMMMLMGFGLVGFGLRKSRRSSLAPQIA